MSAGTTDASECTTDRTSDDEFEDALVDLKIRHVESDSEIKKGIDLAKKALHHFLSNEFNKAKELLAAEYGKTLYSTHGSAVLKFLVALMTFEAEDISEALQSLKDTSAILQKYRRKEAITTSIGKALGLTESAELTEKELHSELVFAECLFFRSALTVIQDENLINFIKGAMKIRQAYQTYNSCHKIVKKIDWGSDELLTHFAGGVYLGCGAFNVFMSALPPRVLSLLEWVGFLTNKSEGFKQLTKAYELDNVRSDLGALYLLVYHLFIAQQIAAHDEDLEVAGNLLDRMLKIYPDGVYFLMFKGKLEEIKGNFTEAVTWLEKSINTQTEWKNFSHICYWELMFCHAFKLEWMKAYKCAKVLRDESNWSKCIYAYLCAIFLIMADGKSEKNQEKIDEHMRDVPKLKQKIAGKSIPMEKFVCRKARKYFEQGRHLVLPAVEMLYVWNGMTMLAGGPEFRDKQLQLINQAKEELELKNEQYEKSKADKDSGSKKSSADPEFNYFDDYCLLQLLKGMCLKFADQPLQAELCFTDVKENHKGIKKDHYVTPFACVELGWMYMDQKRFDEAKVVLKCAKQDYKHYSHESKLHFRMHSAQTRLSILTGNKKKDRSSSNGSCGVVRQTSQDGVRF